MCREYNEKIMIWGCYAETVAMYQIHMVTKPATSMTWHDYAQRARILDNGITNNHNLEHEVIELLICHIPPKQGAPHSVQLPPDVLF